MGPSWAGCADKPFYHPSPPSGWVNDPNGVCWAPDGALHTFFQHVEGSADWGWACAWGHAVSEDCGAWAPRPVALRPTPRGPDAAGAWSGCLVLPEPGANHPPTILYTGVGLRGGEVDERSPPVPPHADLGLPAVEVQCAAVATEDGGLDAWTKLGELVIEHAPELEGAALRPAAPATALAPHTWAGFRDPFVTHARTPTEPWRLLLGSGTGGNGAVLVYESTADAPATPAWRFAGFATTGAPRPTIDLGCMWECPFMVPVPEWDDGGDARGGGERACLADESLPRPPPPGDPNAHLRQGRVLLGVSPFMREGVRPSTPTCVFVGALDARGRLPLDAPDTVGPLLLDLGDILYAATAARPVAVPPAAEAPPSLRRPVDDGRPLILAWLQEEKRDPGVDYAGCLSLPRRLWLRPGSSTLCQAPDPGVALLRVGSGVATPTLIAPAGTAVELPGAAGAATDLLITLRRDGERRARATAILLRPWLHDGPETKGVPATAAVVVDWEARTLGVDYFGETEGDSRPPVWASRLKTAGGPAPDLLAPDTASIKLRILVDHSAVEVFTGGGAALATRVYRSGRGAPTPDAAPYLLAADGGDAVAADVTAWRMQPCWQVEEGREEGGEG